jgi:hypothetical protein
MNGFTFSLFAALFSFVAAILTFSGGIIIAKEQRELIDLMILVIALRTK